MGCDSESCNKLGGRQTVGFFQFVCRRISSCHQLRSRTLSIPLRGEGDLVGLRSLRPRVWCDFADAQLRCSQAAVVYLVGLRRRFEVYRALCAKRNISAYEATERELVGEGSSLITDRLMMILRYTSLSERGRGRKACSWGRGRKRPGTYIAAGWTHWRTSLLGTERFIPAVEPLRSSRQRRVPL